MNDHDCGESCPTCRVAQKLADELRKIYADDGSRDWESLASSYAVFLAHAGLSVAALTADREGLVDVASEVDDTTVVTLARTLVSIGQLTQMIHDGTLFD